jgi:hypothetical protein
MKMLQSTSLKSCDLTVVPVRFRLRAPFKINDLEQFCSNSSNTQKTHTRRIVDTLRTLFRL